MPGCPGLVPHRLQHGLPGGAPLLPHPAAGDGAGPQTQGRVRGGFMDRDPLPHRWAARLHRRRLPISQVRSKTSHNDCRAPVVLLLVSDRRVALHLRHLLREVRLGAGHLLHPPQHGRVCLRDLSSRLARQSWSDAVHLPRARDHQGLPPRLPV